MAIILFDPELVDPEIFDLEVYEPPIITSERGGRVWMREAPPIGVLEVYAKYLRLRLGEAI